MGEKMNRGDRLKKRMFIPTCKTCADRETPIEHIPCSLCRPTGWRPRPEVDARSAILMGKVKGVKKEVDRDG